MLLTLLAVHPAVACTCVDVPAVLPYWGETAPQNVQPSFLVEGDYVATLEGPGGLVDAAVNEEAFGRWKWVRLVPRDLLTPGKQYSVAIRHTSRKPARSDEFFFTVVEGVDHEPPPPVSLSALRQVGVVTPCDREASVMGVLERPHDVEPALVLVYLDGALDQAFPTQGDKRPFFGGRGPCSFHPEPLKRGEREVRLTTVDAAGNRTDGPTMRFFAP